MPVRTFHEAFGSETISHRKQKPPITGRKRTRDESEQKQPAKHGKLDLVALAAEQRRQENERRRQENERRRQEQRECAARAAEARGRKIQLKF